MPDTREITIKVRDKNLTHEAISQDPREFGCWMREMLASADLFGLDSARHNLRENFGVDVTSVTRVFDDNK